TTTRLANGARLANSVIAFDPTSRVAPWPIGGRAATHDGGVVRFFSGSLARRGTLACAPRFAAVLARALAGTARVGDASHPPLPQTWTRGDSRRARRGFFSGSLARRGTLACAPRFAAVLARALAGTARVGDASHP